MEEKDISQNCKNIKEVALQLQREKAASIGMMVQNAIDVSVITDTKGNVKCLQDSEGRLFSY